MDNELKVIFYKILLGLLLTASTSSVFGKDVGTDKSSTYAIRVDAEIHTYQQLLDKFSSDIRLGSVLSVCKLNKQAEAIMPTWNIELAESSEILGSYMEKIKLDNITKDKIFTPVIMAANSRLDGYKDGFRHALKIMFTKQLSKNFTKRACGDALDDASKKFKLRGNSKR